MLNSFRIGWNYILPIFSILYLFNLRRKRGESKGENDQRERPLDFRERPIDIKIPISPEPEMAGGEKKGEPVKKILFSLMTLILVVALVGAGTMAWFNDTEVSSGNTFTAGTLDLAIGGENPNLSPDFTLGNLAPGASGTQTLALRNVGSLAGFLDLSGISVVDAEGVNPESETGETALPGELSSNIWVTVTLGKETVYSGLLSGIAATYDMDFALAANAATDLIIAWVVDKDNRAPLGEDVLNDVQGDIVTLGFTVELDQIAD